MTRLCFAFLAILAVASAFTVPAPLKATSVASKPLFMFSAEDGKASAEKSAGLAEVAPGESADALKETTTLEASTAEDFAAPEKQTMMVKNRNTGEMVEVEVNESFLANEKLEMSWWSWVGFVALPLILLTNDVLHFIPADGPLKFLIKY